MLVNNAFLMSKPFIYSKIAEGVHFVGRQEEVKRLCTDFIFLTNTAVTAPQGRGKSSLIHKAALEARHMEKSLRFAFVELSNVRNEERFFELLAQGVLKAVSKSQADVVENVKKYFHGITPRVAFDADGSFAVDFDWEEIRRNIEQLIDLPFTVAKDMGVKMVVCIDDFSAISHFSDPDALMDIFKTRWPRHTGVAYCISSDPQPVTEKFLKSTPMFYRYGDMLSLGGIARSEMVRLIRERFADGGKYLDAEISYLIMDLTDGHAFYTQQLAHLSWLGTSVVCSREVVLESFETIVDQMDMVFKNITESLTTQQLCYLHAVLAGETVISTSEVLHRHHITSATSASRSKVALLERGVVCNVDGRICLADPVYAYWLKNRYFTK